MDDLDRMLINAYQGGFPLTERPFAEVAAKLGISEDEAVVRVGRLLEAGTVSRFGPLYQIERMGGVFTLAAMSVPAHDYERVAALVNAQPEVAHNYAREHTLNMWFVAAVETAEALLPALLRIEQITGYPVYNFPKEREYFVGMQWQA